MNSLKSAFGKEDKINEKISSNISKSINRMGKGKSDSMWALDMEEPNCEISLENDQKLNLLNSLIKEAFQKQPNLSDIIFDRIVQQFQDSIGSNSAKSQIAYLLAMQDKITDLIDLIPKSNKDFYRYLGDFHQKIQDKIAMLRKKEKKSDLASYQQIANNNFKKRPIQQEHRTPNFLQVGGLRTELKVKSRQKSKQSKKSNEKVLNRLLSKQKVIKQKQFHIKKQKQEDDYLMHETMMNNNQSVSYSAIMSASVAVKQRRPRKGSNQFNNINAVKSKQIKKNQQETEQNEEKTDQAFIFFRPKKGKK